MTERGESFDSAQEPAREQPPKQLSPAGMSAMRGEPGNDATASAPPDAPPEVPREQPAPAGGDVGQEPAAVPEQPSSTAGDRNRLDQPQPASADRSWSEQPADGYRDRLDQPQPSVNDRDRVDPPQPGVSDRDRVDPPQPGVNDRDRVDPPQPGVSDRDRVEPPQPGISDRDRLEAQQPATGDRGRMDPPQSPDARSVPAELPQGRYDQPWNDPSRPEPAGNLREPAANPEPGRMSEQSPDLKSPERIPERVTEKAVPHDASDVANGPREDYVLPDGSPTKITGDLNRFKDLNHQQGEVGDYQGTCGICAAQCVANEHGLPVSEADVLKNAAENQPPLCETDPAKLPEHRGGTTPETRAELLTNMGVPSHVETGKNFDDLSKYIDDGKSVILSTNAGYLWDDPNYAGEDPSIPNHAVTLIDVAHDPKTDDVQGFYINDSGNNDEGQGSGRFVDLNTMRNAWLNTGGKVVVSDNAHR